MQEGTPCGPRTRNLRIRSPTPCPLGQGGMLQPRMSRHPSYYSHAPPCYINNKSQTRLREELPTCCGAFIIHAHARSRTRVTSMGGLYDAATLHALLHKGPYLDKGDFWYSELLAPTAKSHFRLRSSNLYSKVSLFKAITLQATKYCEVPP